MTFPTTEQQPVTRSVDRRAPTGCGPDRLGGLSGFLTSIHRRSGSRLDPTLYWAGEFLGVIAIIALAAIPFLIAGVLP